MYIVIIQKTIFPTLTQECVLLDTIAELETWCILNRDLRFRIYKAQEMDMVKTIQFVVRPQT